MATRNATSAGKRATKTTTKRDASNVGRANTNDAVLIYVHGVGAQPNRDVLKQRWDMALFGRDLGERSRMAYWSDLLHPVQDEGMAPLRRARGVGSTADGSRESIDLDRVLGTGAPLQAIRFSESLVDALGAPATMSGSSSRAVRGGLSTKVLPLPRWARRPISRAFLEAFVKDTAAYFFADGMKARMQQRLLEQIRAAADHPITIIAHSQGSILAYEVLAALAPTSIRLEAFITVGSPLGIQEVQDHLTPDTCEVPAIVKRWHNVADLLDPVAFDKHLGSDFTSTDPMVQVQDQTITSGQGQNSDGFNPHSAVNYLSHPHVRRVVNDVMRMDSMARFVMARDVAEKLGSEPQQRHPVLIEVLEPGYRALGEANDDRDAAERAERGASAVRAGAVGAAQIDDHASGVTVENRITNLAKNLRGLVDDVAAARIDPLRRFVAAHLTASELQKVGAMHRELRVYAMWQSSRKSKLTDVRSVSAVKSDAALASFNADGRDITWAVLDTGIEADHPHFVERVRAVYDCTVVGAPKLVDKAHDRDGHGTHVAGIIAGQSKANVKCGPNDEMNLRGLAPKAKLVIYKVLDDSGHGEDAWIIKALDHIAHQNDNAVSGMAIHGINLSLGGAFDHTVYGCGFSPICAELRRLWRNGTLVVVACGNEGQLQVQTPDGNVEINTSMSVGDPANLDECIAVGSVHPERPHLYGISPFSSRGPTADGRAKPDVVAPGERILSCNAQWNRRRSGQYIYESGTSMAAPHVSGLLAAFLSVRREYQGRPDEVKAILLQHCNDLGRDRYHQGRGLPNLMQMLLAV